MLCTRLHICILWFVRAICWHENFSKYLMQTYIKENPATWIPNIIPTTTYRYVGHVFSVIIIFAHVYCINIQMTLVKYNIWIVKFVKQAVSEWFLLLFLASKSAYRLCDIVITYYYLLRYLCGGCNIHIWAVSRLNCAYPTGQW